MKFTIALLAGLLMMGTAFAQQKEQRVIAAIWMKPVSSTVKVCALLVIALILLF